MLPTLFAVYHLLLRTALHTLHSLPFGNGKPSRGLFSVGALCLPIFLIAHVVIGHQISDPVAGKM
jgi:hypothetical protein